MVLVDFGCRVGLPELPPGLSGCARDLGTRVRVQGGDHFEHASDRVLGAVFEVFREFVEREDGVLFVELDGPAVGRFRPFAAVAFDNAAAKVAAEIPHHAIDCFAGNLELALPLDESGKPDYRCMIVGEGRPAAYFPQLKQRLFRNLV